MYIGAGRLTIRMRDVAGVDDDKGHLGDSTGNYRDWRLVETCIEQVMTPDLSIGSSFGPDKTLS